LEKVQGKFEPPPAASQHAAQVARDASTTAATSGPHENHILSQLHDGFNILHEKCAMVDHLMLEK
jgi:hypothetical protein